MRAGSLPARASTRGRRAVTASEARHGELPTREACLHEEQGDAGQREREQRPRAQIAEVGGKAPVWQGEIEGTASSTFRPNYAGARTLPQL